MARSDRVRHEHPACLYLRQLLGVLILPCAAARARARRQAQRPAFRVARLLGQHVGDEQLRRRARLIQNLMQTAGPLVGVAATAVGSLYAGLKGILG